MNNLPCGKCREYDAIIGSRQVPTGYGRCVPKSVYPTQEGPGQRFPPGAKRAAEGAMPKLEVVKKNEVVPHCLLAKELA